MSPPIVTGETTVRELEEILGRFPLLALGLRCGGTPSVGLRDVYGRDQGYVRGPDLASAINAALAKAGAR